MNLYKVQGYNHAKFDRLSSLLLLLLLFLLLLFSFLLLLLLLLLLWLLLLLLLLLFMLFDPNSNTHVITVQSALSLLESRDD